MPDSHEPAGPPTIPSSAGLIHGDDPRFRHLLERGESLSFAVTRLSNHDGQALLDRVAERQRLLSAPTIEDEGLALVGAAAGLAVGHPRVVAMATRFGLSGDEPPTMAEIAGVLGVSRARVGQISNRIRSNLPTRLVWAPMTDQALQILHSVVPCPVADINEALQGAGLTALTWTAPALVAAAALTGRKLDLHEQDGYAIASGNLGIVRAIYGTARRISDRNGAASVDQVVAEMGPTPYVSEAVVRDVLSGRTDITWLSQEWFWTDHGATRNRLVNTSQRILAVHQPQELRSMIEGVSRNYSWRNSTGRSEKVVELQVPPTTILGALYASHPSFSVDDSGIKSARPIDLDSLGPEKLTLVGILRAQPWPAMSRGDLIEACRAEGMNPATASIFLTYAECIENLGHNVWGLRGAGVSGSVVNELQRSARERSRNFDQEIHEGVTEGGRPWFAQRLTPGILHSGVLIARWSTNLDEHSSLTVIDGTDGEQTGTVRRTGSFVYGLSRLIRKNRPSVGDFLRVVLYRQDGYVVAELGGDELTERPDDWS